MPGYYLGIDVGSTASKCVIIDEDKTIVASAVIPVGTGTTGPARAFAASLEEAGITIHTIPSAELSRGRGGPRCMSMPLWRENP